MTVSTTTQLVQHTAAGGTVFAFNFMILDEDELVVKTADTDGVETTRVLGVDYTVSAGPWPSGGNVTFSVAPTIGHIVAIYNEPSPIQDVDLPAAGTLPADQVESALDRVVLVSQRTRDLVRRAATLPDASTLTEISLPLPRARYLLGWNAAGDGLENVVEADATSAAAAAISAAAALAAQGLSEDARDAAVVAQGFAEDARDAAQLAETNAEAAEAVALASANFLGSWSALTGAATVPSSVLHNSAYWMLLNNLADITLSEPGVSADWENITPVLSALGTGILAKIGTETYAARSIDVDTDDLQIANPAGTAGNPTLALAFTVTTFIKSLLATTTNAGARAAIGAERAFASTTLTFASVAAATDGTPQNWAHGLGTDDIDFGITVEHDNAAVSYTTKAAAAIGANGAWAMFGDGSGLPADPNVPADAPATGNIRVNVRNLAGSTSTIRVHIWARAR